MLSRLAPRRRRQPAGAREGKGAAAVAVHYVELEQFGHAGSLASLKEPHCMHRK